MVTTSMHYKIVIVCTLATLVISQLILLDVDLMAILNTDDAVGVTIRVV